MEPARGRGSVSWQSTHHSAATIEPAASADDAEWLAMRRALWPDCSVGEHQQEISATVAAPDRFGAWLARDPTHRACGLAEASVRSDYVNGTDSTPVAFLEGLYVTPAARRQGIARELVAAVAAWGRARGCRELASDTPLANEGSQAMHRALGFEETERVVYFRKTLT